MKNIITQEIKKALIKLDYYHQDVDIYITVPKNKEFGDLSTNIAFLLSKKINKSSLKIAEDIQKNLKSIDIFKNINIAGTGFINFKINPNSIVNYLNDIIKLNNNYGKNESNHKKVLIEFVSANPTGPLTVGHGRGAILGDTLSNIFEWNGYEVEREYYYNNAGRQMRILGNSVKARYLDLIGEKWEFPEDGYQGDYIHEIAKQLLEIHGHSLKEKNEIFKEFSEKFIFDNIRNTLKNIGIIFDSFFNENTLYENKDIYKIIDALDKKGLIYKKDDAVWFRGTKVGRENDRVLIKKTGEPTYRLPDMAYHIDKMKRGYDLCIDIFGADHMDAYPDVLEVVHQLGFDKSNIKVLIHQFISVLKNGKQVKMSTRKATYITLDDLIEQVSPDVVRYFFIMRSMNSHLDFDLNLASDQSDSNPVFYLQYAYARICNIIKHGENNSLNLKQKYDPAILCHTDELKLLKHIVTFPELVETTSKTLEPQNIATYLQELAALFHRFYGQCRVISDNSKLSKARLNLVSAVKITLENGLKILGISAPEKM